MRKLIYLTCFTSFAALLGLYVVREPVSETPRAPLVDMAFVKKGNAYSSPWSASTVQESTASTFSPRVHLIDAPVRVLPPQPSKLAQRAPSNFAEYFARDHYKAVLHNYQLWQKDDRCFTLTTSYEQQLLPEFTPSNSSCDRRALLNILNQPVDALRSIESLSALNTYVLALSTLVYTGKMESADIGLLRQNWEHLRERSNELQRVLFQDTQRLAQFCQNNPAPECRMPPMTSPEMAAMPEFAEIVDGAR